MPGETYTRKFAPAFPAVVVHPRISRTLPPFLILFSKEISVGPGVYVLIYIVFERRSPEGLNMGYDGTAGVPEGSHYFYKAFTVYGDGKQS